MTAGVAAAPALAGLWLLAAASLATPAEGAGLGVLVVTDRADGQEALAPALDVIATELRRHGHRVAMDRPATPAIAKTIARARARPGAPLDVVAVLGSVFETRKRTYTRHTAVSLSATVYGVTTGRVLARLRGITVARRLAEACGGPCAARRRAALAEAAAQELAPRLAARIGALDVVPARVIRLEGLAPPARGELLAYLRRLPGTRAMAAPVKTVTEARLRYVGTLGVRPLRRAIIEVLAHADIAAAVAISGPFITITERPRPEGAAAGWRNW